MNGAVGALLAHELNNIAVPLAGFAEEVLQRFPSNSAAQECVGEFQLAAHRIKALAHDLESLGQTESAPEAIALGDCLRQALAVTPELLPQIEWACRQDIKVRVDPWHAQRAIASLIRIAMVSETRLHQDAVTVAQNDAAGLECAGCGAKLPPDGAWVLIRTSEIRRLDLSLLRDPFRAKSGGRISRRLSFAVLACCAHRAGGHISLDPTSADLTLAFPAP